MPIRSMADRYPNEVAAYKAALEAEIAADAAKSSWTRSQWRTHYIQEVTETVSKRITERDVMDLFGAVRGSVLLGEVKADNEFISRMLHVSEGGLDISHSETAGVLNATSATDPEKAQLLALAQQTGPRWTVQQLPKPREGFIQAALDQIGA